jgi:hypothetical protein
MSVESAQLAVLPVLEGRTAGRRVVNLAARLRDPGAKAAPAYVRDLSITGFMAETDLALADRDDIWVKLPGLEARSCSLIWSKDGRHGFEFATPLDVLTLEGVVTASRRPVVKGHFGPQH